MVLKKQKNIIRKDFKSKDVRLRGYYSIIFVLVLILVDRITKIWAANQQINKDCGLIAFTYVTNTGAGFSIMQNMNILLIIISIIVLAIMIYYRNEIPKISFFLIISGIIGNLLDRIFFGSVIDFINFKFWPIFNIADSLIVIGVAYWIIALFRNDISHKKPSSKKKNT